MNKILKTKILLLFLLTLFATNNASAGGDNLALSTESTSLMVQIAQKRVTINMKGSTLRAILNEVQKQSGISILYKDAEVDAISKKDLTVKNVTVEEALKTILSGTNLEYKVTGNSISIFQKKAPIATNSKKVMVSGKVVDMYQKPIIGATVTAVGTTRGAITDPNGSFLFSTSDNDVLEISYTGKKSVLYKNIALNNKNIVIELLDDAMAVDDVIVTGYGDVQRKDAVMTQTTLKSEDFMVQSGNNLEEMLQGKVAGMIVTSESSRVGSSPKIQIRGTSTLIGNRDPLWVVDGVIQEDPIQIDPNNLLSEDLRDMVGSQISWLNPMDIDKITVLKDASATAVYGSKASNGVIVITTKKGKPGKLSVSYSGTVKVASQPNYGQFNMMDSKERTNFIDEAFDAGLKYQAYPLEQLETYEGSKLMYTNRKITAEQLIQRRNRLETVNTDWFDLLTRSAVSHNHNLSVSGGSDLITYNASIGYSSNKGQEIGNDGENLTGRVSLNITPHPKIRIAVALNGSTTENTGFAGVNPLSYATNTSRNIEAFNEEGELSFYSRPTTFIYNSDLKSLKYNVLNERDNTSATVKLGRIAASLTLNWRINNWLSYNFSGGYTQNTNKSRQIKGERTYYTAQKYRGYEYGTESAESPKFKAAWYPFGGELTVSDGLQTSYNIQNKFLFNKDFGNGHRFNAMVAMEVRSMDSETTSSMRAGYSPDRGDRFLPATTIKNHVPIGGASNNDVIRDAYDMAISRLTSNFISVFATAAYVLKDKYVFNATVRNDFSNKFGQDTNRRLDPTYSFGAMWKVYEEKFMKDKLSWLSDLSLKATYGIQGNAPTESPELTLLRNGTMHMMNQYYSTIGNIPNPNLSWERTQSWDFGVEFTLFDMFSTTFDYYMRTSNAMTRLSLSPEFGIKNMLINDGQLFNDGIEISVSFSPIQTKNFSLNVSMNTSKNWNSIGRNIMPIKWNDYLDGTTSKFIQEGYPLGAMWSYDFAGLSPNNGTPMFNGLDLRPGDVRSNELNPLPYLVYSGSSLPSFTGGLTLGFRYKAVTVGTSFSLIMGKMKRLPSPYSVLTQYYMLPDVYTNLSKDLLNRWQKPGDELTTNFPAIVTSGGEATTTIPGSAQNVSAYDLWAKSTAMTVNSSFLRCREIKVSWRMREGLVKKLKLNSLSVTASVNNPFVIANKRFNGFDPELNNSVRPKDYVLGVSIGF